MKLSTIVLFCVALLAWGCGGGNGGEKHGPTPDATSEDGASSFEYEVDKSCLKFFPVEPGSWYGPPSAVMAFFRVENCAGKPVPLLTLDDFELVDDKQASSAGLEAELLLVSPKIGVRMYTVLLLDVSGSILKSNSLPVMIESAEAFLEELLENPNLSMEVAVYLFDGRDQIVELAGFSSDANELSKTVKSLAEPECEIDDDCPDLNPYCYSGLCVHRSTNLHGAVIHGLEVLETKLAGVDSTMLRQGYLTVFTDGTDQAHNPEYWPNKAQAAVDATDLSVFTIGLGGEIDEAELTALGKNGAAFAADQTAVKTAFKAIATEVVARSLSYYIAGYCSPRTGSAMHDVEIWVPGSTGAYSLSYDSGVFEDGLCAAENITDPCNDIECGQSAWLNCGTCEACGNECVEGSCTFTACEGKQCGDDGCGGTCPNTCEGPQDECVENECVCQPDCEDKQCGTDGCGGTCGECTGSQDECIDGACVCQPACADKTCGDNGCEGVCGECDELEVCVDDQCTCAWQECGGLCCQETQVCADGACCMPACEGKECGEDGCGGECGPCSGSQDECVDGQCVCQPACEGKECGDDGCGASCGECPADQACNTGVCCKPDCDGKQCGDDGCGSTCGTCPQGAICDNFSCLQKCVQPVHFSLQLDWNAEEVLLSGEFNGWGENANTATVMSDLDGDWKWEATVGLEPSSYEYKFIADNNWLADPENPLEVPDSFGGYNSLIIVEDCPCEPTCAEKQCGDDGCGGTCGSCSGQDTCEGGQCTCQPDCLWKQCGDDGCEGSCGECLPGPDLTGNVEIIEVQLQGDGNVAVDFKIALANIGDAPCSGETWFVDFWAKYPCDCDVAPANCGPPSDQAWVSGQDFDSPDGGASVELAKQVFFDSVPEEIRVALYVDSVFDFCAESHENNNFVCMDLPLHVEQVAMADLTVEACWIGNNPDDPPAVVLSALVKNNGTAPSTQSVFADFFLDGEYCEDPPFLELGDAYAEVPPLAPGESVLTMDIYPGLPLGTYEPVVLVDGFQEIPESNMDNNCCTTGQFVQKNLPL